ncbi:UDP-N-acetylmuramoyl-tripeptide--D-alanyl-D-alanine ligase [Marininema halotolerans]|nr:UDP-N-acetylmuramoyl-tripeptide--D-alanyl-D-alanine ligase [Marininema halotolerans]
MRLGQFASLAGGSVVRGNPQSIVNKVVFSLQERLNPQSIKLIHPAKSMERQLSYLRQQRSGVVVTVPSLKNHIPKHLMLITVASLKRSLWKVCAWQRNHSKATFIGITGSSGKTTTKEMATAILMRRYRTLKSQENMNIASLMHYHHLRLDSRYQVAVLEMGMKTLGDIRQQCVVARPTIGVVTCVKEAHVGHLGNSLQNVVRAKQELVDGVKPGGILIINADDPGVRKLRVNPKKHRVLTFGTRPGATYQATHIRYTKQGMEFNLGKTQYHIPIWGEHNVYNALAAIAIAKQLKVPDPIIKDALRKFPVPKMRLQRVPGKNRRLLINDAYNANPSAMIAGLDVLRKVSGPSFSVAVLGSMNELGSHSTKGHLQVGQRVAATRPRLLVTVGNEGKKIAQGAISAGFPRNKVHTFPNQPNVVASFLNRHVPPGAVLYFKASRSLKLEHIVNRLK